jgi:hypothetical protein
LTRKVRFGVISSHRVDLRLRPIGGTKRTCGGSAQIRLREAKYPHMDMIRFAEVARLAAAQKVD